MKNMKKILVLALAALLLVAVGVGGTLAWLTATSGPVTNTFTPATISVNIDEHKYNKADNSLDTAVDPVITNTDYMMVPGRAIKKDPMVDASSDVPFYVFVTIEKKDWLSALTYGIDSNWKPVPDKDGVYYKEVSNPGTDGKYSIEDIPVLLNNVVNVANTLSATEMAGKNPQLVFNAYAIQTEGTGSVAEAWTKVATTTP